MSNVIDLRRKQDQRNHQRTITASDVNAQLEEINETNGIFSEVPIDELDRVLLAGGLTLGVCADARGSYGIIMRNDE